MLTKAECIAWAEKYRYVPWSNLPLACAADGEPGPITVMRSLLALVRESAPRSPS